MISRSHVVHLKPVERLHHFTRTSCTTAPTDVSVCSKFATNGHKKSRIQHLDILGSALFANAHLVCILPVYSPPINWQSCGYSVSFMGTYRYSDTGLF